MKKTWRKNWQERIDAARAHGGFTDRDVAEMYDWDTCFVGESLREVGVSFLDGLVGERARTLVMLGAGNQGRYWKSIYHTPEAEKVLMLHPVFLLIKNNFNAAEARLHDIQAEVARLYPPPEVKIPALASAKKDKTMTKQKATVGP